MTKTSSLRSRMIVIALGIALGYLAKFVFPISETVPAAPTTSEGTAGLIN